LVDVADASSMLDDASLENANLDASMVLHTPNGNLYIGYLTEDGIPPNGAPFSSGIEFPAHPVTGEFYLRTDYMPNRLFRFSGSSWFKFEDKVRMTLSNTGYDDAAGKYAGKEVSQTLKTSFVNNNTTATINGKVIKQKQALSKALKPKADN
jgi:hypothetical protein